MNGPFALDVFGPPELRDGLGEPVRFRTQKHLALLVYLAFEAKTRGVSREALVDLLWDDVPSEKGRHSLSQAFTALRRILGDEAIPRGGEYVRLAIDLELVAEGEGEGFLERAEFFGSAHYGAWVDGVRASLRRRFQFTTVPSRVAELRHEYPWPAPATGPFPESSGSRHEDRGDAADPTSNGPETDRSAPRFGRGSVRQLLQTRPGSGRADLFPMHESQKRQLLLEIAPTTHCDGPAIILLHGPTGAGKTQLLRDVATDLLNLSRGVVYVRCEDMDRNVPLSGASLFIHALAREAGFGETAPQFIAELTRIVPAIATAFPGVPAPAVAAEQSLRVRLSDALAETLKSVREERDVIYMVDGVQNLDPASLEIMRLVLAHISDEPLSFVFAARSDNGPRLGAEAFRGFSYTREIRLDPLDVKETKAFLRWLGSSASRTSIEREAEALQSIAAGNPGLLECLHFEWDKTPTPLHAMLTGGSNAGDIAWSPSTRLKRIVEAQLGQLSEHGRNMLAALAVAARALPLETLDRLMPSPSGCHAATLDAVRLGVLRVGEAGVAFANDLFRAYTLAVTDPNERALYHARIARLMLDHAANDFTTYLEASHHYQRAGDRESAVAAAMRGAAVALTRGAPNAATEMLQSVMPDSIDGVPLEAIKLLTTSLEQQGAFEELYRWIYRVRARASTSQELAESFLVEAEALHRGRLAADETIRAAASKSVSCNRTNTNTECFAKALLIQAEVAADMWDWDTVHRVRAEARREARCSTDASRAALASLTEGYCSYVSGRFAEGYRLLVSTLEPLRDAGMRSEQTRAWNGIGICALSLGEFTIALQSFESGLKLAEDDGNRVTASNVCSNIGSVLTDLGGFSQARQYFQRAMELDVTSGGSRYSPIIALNLADLEIIEGDIDAAERLVTHAESRNASLGLRRHSVDTLLYRAELCGAKGCVGDAIGFLRTAIEIAHDESNLVGEIARLERGKAYVRWYETGRTPKTGTPVQVTPIPTARMADQLEILAYYERFAETRESYERRSIGHKILKDLKLVGVLKRLDRGTGQLPCRSQGN